MNHEQPDFDLYEELEVSPRASTEVIEAAYRRLAQMFHPDQYRGQDRDRMTRLNIAREILTDPMRRAGYDLQRNRSSQPVQGPPPQGTAPQEPEFSPDSRSTVASKRFQWRFVVAICVVVMVYGIYRANTANFPDAVAHPIAVFLGNIVHLLWGAPLSYWLAGKIYSRNHAMSEGPSPNAPRHDASQQEPQPPTDSEQSSDAGEASVRDPEDRSRIFVVALAVVGVVVTLIIVSTFFVRRVDSGVGPESELPKPLAMAHVDDLDNAFNAYERGDYASALPVFRMYAGLGDARAQSNLGSMYSKGHGVVQDYAEAERWYRMAAVQGHGVAQSQLGFMYAHGQAVPWDYAEALKWYRMAAEQGGAEAQIALGLMYANGQGVPQDDAEAVKWYRLAAEQGDPDAQRKLGNMYREGQGVPQDYAEAERWYRRAAALGFDGRVRRIELPDGRKGLFPADWTQAQIDAATKRYLEEKYPPSK